MESGKKQIFIFSDDPDNVDKDERLWTSIPL